MTKGLQTPRETPKAMSARPGTFEEAQESSTSTEEMIQDCITVETELSSPYGSETQ